MPVCRLSVRFRTNREIAGHWWLIIVLGSGLDITEYCLSPLMFIYEEELFLCRREGVELTIELGKWVEDRMDNVIVCKTMGWS